MFALFLYIINPKKYCISQLRTLCVRAGWAGNALDVLVALKFGFIFIYVHFLNAFCYVEAIKSCLLPFLSNLYCTSFKRSTSIKRPLQSPEGGRFLDSAGPCDWFFHFCFRRLRRSSFHSNISDGVVNEIGRNRNVLILPTSIPSGL